MRASEMPAQAHVVAWAREEATERTGLLRLGRRCALGRSKEPVAAAGQLPERVLGRGAAAGLRSHATEREHHWAARAQAGLWATGRKEKRSSQAGLRAKIYSD
jgi:hypothetical protein